MNTLSFAPVTVEEGGSDFIIEYSWTIRLMKKKSFSQCGKSRSGRRGLVPTVGSKQRINCFTWFTEKSWEKHSHSILLTSR
jgi:hypothetical protein